MSSAERSTFRFKLIISILAGILCFFLSPYSITSHIGNTDISIPFSLLFPIVISMAFGRSYGLLSALFLGAFFPFYIWSNNGLPNFITSILYTTLFIGIGFFYSDKKKGSKSYFRLILFLILFYLLMFMAYRYLFNPLMHLNKFYWFGNAIGGLDENILILFALKDSINISILVIFSDLILQLPHIRRFLNLSDDNKKRVNTAIFFSSIIACLLIWSVYFALGEALLLHSGFKDGHIQLALLIILAGGFIAARIIIHFFERQIEAKDSLFESQRSLQMQFELMPSACIVWSRGQEIVSWNPAAEKVFGFTENEVVGRKANETIVPERIGMDMLEVWNKLLEEGVDFKSINENLTKQGSTIKCEWQNSPLRNNKGEVVGVISMVQDITESKAIEECLEFMTFQKWDTKKISFFDAIVKYLGEKLGFDYVFISRIKENEEKASTVAHFRNGQVAPNITYKLKGSPCENVYNKHLCIYPESIISLFPEDSGLVKLGAESYIGQPLWDSSGNPLGLIALISKKKLVNVNVAKSILNVVSNKVSAEIERYEVEESLRKNEFFFKESQRVANIGSYSTDFKLGIWESSDVLDQIFGIDKNYNRSIPGWLDIIHPDDKEMMNSYLVNEVIGKRSLFDKEYRIVRRSDGAIRWVHGMGQVAFDSEGVVISLIGTISDITDRKLIEDKLRESEDRLSTLFAAMTEMVVLHEVVFSENGEAVDYRIIECNKAFTEITGIKKEDAVGRLATEIYQQEEAPYLREFTQVGITGIPFEYTTYYAPMDKHFMISVVSPKKNVFATITTDITGIKQIQEVISNKNKEMENYLYVASHDLRTPLVNIQGFSQRLQKQTDLIKSYIDQCPIDSEVKQSIDSITGEGISKTLSFINSNVKKMDSLINGLLQISRTGRMKLTIKSINLNELMANIISNHQFQISEIGAKIHIDNLPNCYGDEVQINQLFSNLIANAIKYRDKNRILEIQIKGQVHYNKVIYSIVDNGMGINERHINKIWDVFFKVDSSAPESGEGLGLSIVKRIVEKHKGRIWVESEEGVGSRFNVELQRNEFTE